VIAAVPHFLYLHGFASSVKSKKATFFGQRLAASGFTLTCPDLNEPDFSTLTITRMIDRVTEIVSALDPGPVVLIGSSLGAFVALHAVTRAPLEGHPYDKLIFLAPALDFGGNRMRSLGATGLDRWRESNRLDVVHHGYGRTLPVHYALYEDAARYDSFAVASVPATLIFQGAHDEAVDPESVKRFAALHPNVQLHMLDDDHQLLGSLETIWTETAAFAGIA
jgi:pimeloyl-ACP methyl ester carboxylesterase